MQVLSMRYPNINGDGTNPASLIYLIVSLICLVKFLLLIAFKIVFVMEVLRDISSIYLVFSDTLG